MRRSVFRTTTVALKIRTIASIPGFLPGSAVRLPAAGAQRTDDAGSGHSAASPYISKQVPFKRWYRSMILLMTTRSKTREGSRQEYRVHGFPLQLSTPREPGQAPDRGRYFGRRAEVRRQRGPARPDGQPAWSDYAAGGRLPGFPQSVVHGEHSGGARCAASAGAGGSRRPGPVAARSVNLQGSWGRPSLCDGSARR